MENSYQSDRISADGGRLSYSLCVKQCETWSCIIRWFFFHPWVVWIGGLWRRGACCSSRLSSDAESGVGELSRRTDVHVKQVKVKLILANLALTLTT